MAFGGHFLSDVVLGGLVALIVIESRECCSGRAARTVRARYEGATAAEVVEAALGDRPI